MKQFLVKWLKRFLKLGFILFLTLIFAEIAYRYQWMDTYKTEWNFHNEQTVKKQTNVLVFGDSFTADAKSWFSFLPQSADTAFYNAAIPGIGTETHRLIFTDRIKQTQPKHVLVQLYIGNDLFDIQKPVNWSTQSFGRNCFYSLSNRFRVLNLINYRLGQQKWDLKTSTNPKKSETFVANQYDPRSKLYIQADQGYPQTTIDLNAEKQALFDQLLADLKEMKATLSPNVSFTVLLIPHCTQVHQRYVKHFQLLGGKSSWKSKNTWNEQLKKAGLNVLDPLPYFMELEKDNQHLYFENDIHLTPFGQEKLGNWVNSNWKMHE